jgi:hypothetical protein
MTTLTTQRFTRVPFGRLVRVELSKTVASRSGGWLLTAIGVALVAVLAVKLVLGDAEELTFRSFVEVTSTPLSLLLPLLAILSVTTEWSQRTALSTFTLEPDRARVVPGQAGGRGDRRAAGRRSGPDRRSGRQRPRDAAEGRLRRLEPRAVRCG